MAQTHSEKLYDTSGILLKKDACVVIVKTEWNSMIVDALTQSATELLHENGVSEIDYMTVPGAVEISFAVHSVMQNRKADAIIAFGCVIKGDTPHFEYVCKSVTDGITAANNKGTIPVIFGILTVNDMQQAIDRIKNGKVGDKGAEAAIAALKMIHFTTELKK
jgi:6,7-dimethyl-8-ribityllumazine synthase